MRANHLLVCLVLLTVAGLCRGAAVEKDITSAERLWKAAQAGKLTAEAAEEVGALLDHEDPFVRGLAEWAIAIKVGLDNGGQEIAWPRPDAPPWFRKWSALPPESFLETDYARQAARTRADSRST